MKLVWDKHRWYKFRTIQLAALLTIVNGIQGLFALFTDYMDVKTFALINTALGVAIGIARMIQQFPTDGPPQAPPDAVITEDPK